jgi:hypothetical protein
MLQDDPGDYTIAYSAGFLVLTPVNPPWVFSDGTLHSVRGIWVR